MPTEYNRSHIQGICVQECIILCCFSREEISKCRAWGFIRFPKCSKTMKPQGGRPHRFKYFPVFGNLMKTQGTSS